MQYNGHDLLDIIDQKLHAALRHEVGAPIIQHNTIYDEWEAAERYGYADYWNAPREARAFMCASIKARSLIHIMTQHDYAELAQRKAEAERKKRGLKHAR